METNVTFLSPSSIWKCLGQEKIKISRDVVCCADQRCIHFRDKSHFLLDKCVDRSPATHLSKEQKGYLFRSLNLLGIVTRFHM